MSSIKRAIVIVIAYILFLHVHVSCTLYVHVAQNVTYSVEPLPTGQLYQLTKPTKIEYRTCFLTTRMHFVLVIGTDKIHVHCTFRRLLVLVFNGIFLFKMKFEVCMNMWCFNY